jgi:hypothetical protein
MALQGGHRFAVSMLEAFPHGLYAMGVEQAMDYDEHTGRQTPSKDKVTGELVWTVTCIDRDPMIRGPREVKVKVLSTYCPTLPNEILPNSGIRPVEFTGLVVTAYVSEQGRRARLAFSYRATQVWQQGKVPAELQPQRSAHGAAQGPPPGEGKAA